jgi:hypothetical protein
MTIPSPKVEIGFDLTQSNIAPFFTLDDSVKGVLDNSIYVLGGLTFYNITDRVRSIAITRGRSAQFTEFPSGSALVELNNHDRAFDPVYPDSPFYGNIIPRRAIRISSNDELIFSGFVNDWNFDYQPNGDSIASAVCNDDLGFLNGKTLTASTPSQEFTGERINAILDLAEVNWAPTLRDVETGLSLVGTQAIDDGTNVLSYLQKVAETEPGLLFIAKNGYLTFRDKLSPFNPNDSVTFGNSGGIKFSNVQVTYGAELLYNEITVANQGGGTVLGQDLNSQAAYGVSAYSVTDLLGVSDSQASQYAVDFLLSYASPQYRIEQLEVPLHKLTEAEQNQVLALDIGSTAEVQFTPNGIGNPIIRYGEINQITHDVNYDEHFVNLKFREVVQTVFILDDAVFGKLDTQNVLT